MLRHSSRAINLFVIGLFVLMGNRTSETVQAAPSVTLANPILFVTQVPIPADFTTIASVFGNQHSDLQSVGRGGDLWIRYADGTLKNLTAAAGYGSAGLQGANAIAVRDPSVHWGGTKAVFSMVIGAPTQQYQVAMYYWQLYEISGLGVGETPVITKVLNQPANYNNLSPIYGTDDRVIFTSDRPRNGQPQLYPQLDEYEEAPTVTGLWSLDPTTGDLFMLDHLPSGGFTPSLDSVGRVIFTRWDHLQRDQQADSETTGSTCYSGAQYGTFNYSDESAGATALNSRAEVFPEPRSCRNDLLNGTNLAGHGFNQFFPWQVNEDGTQEETLNHVGRHELLSYFDRSLTDDPNLREFIAETSGRFNPNIINNFLQVREDPLRPGIYFGVDAPEFYTHAAGQVVTISGTVTLDADRMAVQYYTHRDTAGFTPNPGPNHSGHYREPLPMSDGTLVAVHTTQTDLDKNLGTRANPLSQYDFRLKTLKVLANGFWGPDQLLTGGISKTISYWDPDVLVSFSGNLWELNPVEVRARTRPTRITPVLPSVEQQVIANAGVNLAQLQAYMRQRNLALVVSRNVTTRDDADRQQPFNLRVPAGAQTIGASGKIYDVRYIQFFQADQIRGLGYPNPRAGRRVLAQPMHDSNVVNPPNPTGPPGSVIIASDGSQAAFVPARRALSWQLTDGAGVPVVRERYWLTFQPGEIRVCTSCHGLNENDQAGNTTPNNPPQALSQLLASWQTLLNETPRVYLPLVVR